MIGLSKPPNEDLPVFRTKLQDITMQTIEADL